MRPIFYPSSSYFACSFLSSRSTFAIFYSLAKAGCIFPYSHFAELNAHCVFLFQLLSHFIPGVSLSPFEYVVKFLLAAEFLCYFFLRRGFTRVSSSLSDSLSDSSTICVRFFPAFVLEIAAKLAAIWQVKLSAHSSRCAICPFHP